MPLTLEERVKIRAHLGYGNYSVASTFQFGTPAGVETAFLLEPAMNKLLPEAEGLCRQVLKNLDEVLCKLAGTNDNLEVDQIGEIHLRSDFDRALMKRYEYWIGMMCDMLGVPPNPYTKRFGSFGGGGLNVRVSG